IIPLTYTMQTTHALSGAPATTIANTFHPLNIAVQLILMIWIFFTMLVLPCLAQQDTTLINAIKNSAFTVKKRWLEIISGGLIYFVLGVIFIFPVMFALNYSASFLVLTLLYLALILPLTCISSAVFTLFKGLVVYSAPAPRDAT